MAFFFLDYYNEVIGYFFHKFQWCFHFSIYHSIWGVATIYLLSFHWVIAHHVDFLIISMNLYWFLYCKWVSKMALFVGTHIEDCFRWCYFKKVNRHLYPCISFFLVSWISLLWSVYWLGCFASFSPLARTPYFRHLLWHWLLSSFCNNYKIKYYLD